MTFKQFEEIAVSKHTKNGDFLGFYARSGDILLEEGEFKSGRWCHITSDKGDLDDFWKNIILEDLIESCAHKTELKRQLRILQVFEVFSNKIGSWNGCDSDTSYTKLIRIL